MLRVLPLQLPPGERLLLCSVSASKSSSPSQPSCPRATPCCCRPLPEDVTQRHCPPALPARPRRRRLFLGPLSPQLTAPCPLMRAARWRSATPRRLPAPPTASRCAPRVIIPPRPRACAGVRAPAPPTCPPAPCGAAPAAPRPPGRGDRPLRSERLLTQLRFLPRADPDLPQPQAHADGPQEGGGGQEGQDHGALLLLLLLLLPQLDPSCCCQRQRPGCQPHTDRPAHRHAFCHLELLQVYKEGYDASKYAGLCNYQCCKTHTPAFPLQCFESKVTPSPWPPRKSNARRRAKRARS